VLINCLYEMHGATIKMCVFMLIVVEMKCAAPRTDDTSARCRENIACYIFLYKIFILICLMMA